MTETASADDTSGRRAAERRKRDEPHDGADRRKAERRSGKDRRSNPRISAQ